MIRLPRLAVACIALALATPALAADAKPDFSSPKATLKATLDLLSAGRFDQLADAFVKPATPEETDLLKNGWTEDAYVPALVTAAHAKFGEASSAMPDMDAMVKAAIDKMDVEKVDDSTVVLKPAGATRPGRTPLARSTRLIKVGAEWKMTLAPGQFLQTPDPKNQRTPALVAVLKQGLLDVLADKYATFEVFDKDIEAKCRAVEKQFGRAATAPAD